MVDLPPLRALQVFEAVGRCGGITKAARDLGVSPGAISQQIRHLEEALGLQLIIRKAGGVSLTQLGARYYEDVSACIHGLRKAHHAITTQALGQGVVISALPLIAARWLSPAIFDFQQRHPGTTIHIAGSLVEPAADSFDFRVTYADRVSQLDYSATLFTDSLVPVCSPKLLAARPVRVPADLLDFQLLGIDWRPFFSPSPGWQSWFRHVGVSSGVIADTLVFSHSSLAIEAAIDGHGVALAQSSLIAEDLKSGRLVRPFELAQELPAPYVVAWNSSAFAKNGARDIHRWIIRLSSRYRSRSKSNLLSNDPANNVRKI
jgi:LysR family transcriptional regulator, glycine cleavage system transcriptional activator